MSKINTGMMTSSSEEYATPNDLFVVLNSIYNFTLDAAASKHNAKCKKYLTAEDDALSKDWAQESGGGAVWLNPPYGRKISPFMEKALNESRKGVAVVCLVPARTDAAWWHDYAMAGDLVFIRGRLKFEPIGKSAPFPSALVIYDPMVDRRDYYALKVAGDA